MARLHFRGAVVGDIDALSRLLMQLYAHELPGMLHGPEAAQVEFARRILSAAPLGRRYVLERDGGIVGMGSLATDDEPRPDVPARALLPPPLLLGPLNGTRSLVGAARGLLTALGAPSRDEGQIHYVETEHRPGPFRRALAYPSVIMRRELPITPRL